MMKPTDEMVHRMRDALEGIANLSYSEAWAALTAALSASPAGVVKPLEWEGDEYVGWTARAAGHLYEIDDDGSDDEKDFTLEVVIYGRSQLTRHETLDAAKSAAFADYSARIMSAIEPAGVGVETPPPQTHVMAEWESREGCVGPMTASRATYFLERFKREEKMLGPHEQWALDFAIAALATTEGQS